MVVIVKTVVLMAGGPDVWHTALWQLTVTHEHIQGKLHVILIFDDLSAMISAIE